MTPEEHLHRARLALDEAERRDGSAGNLGPSRLFGQATAHALVGILEHLREVNSTVDGSGFGRSFDKEQEKNREALLDAVHGFPTPPNLFTINHQFTADDEVIKEVATKVFIDGLGRIVQAIDEAEKPDSDSGGTGDAGDSEN